MHCHCLWRVEALQLLQDIHRLLSFLGEAADVLLPLEVLGDDGSQEVEGLQCQVDKNVKKKQKKNRATI